MGTNDYNFYCKNLSQVAHNDHNKFSLKVYLYFKHV